MRYPRVLAPVIVAALAGVIPVAAGATPSPPAGRGHIGDAWRTSASASWEGRVGDLVSRTYLSGLWNQPDGWTDATFDLDFTVRPQGRRTPLLTRVTLTTDTGCYWRTDGAFGNWGIALTRQGSDVVLNTSSPLSMGISLTPENRSLTLHVQEPEGWECASPAVAYIAFTVDGFTRTVTVNS